MRLLDAKTYQPMSFEEDEVPEYAILSHTWGRDEVSFQDIQCQDQPPSWKTGFAKIRYACEETRRRNLDYVWVDTCCIDKSSSAELSEAINSMFRWYKNARVCFAYLADVTTIMTDLSFPQSAFLSSRWFDRGWTLQELLAPRSMHFFSSSWRELGSKYDLRRQISDITGISIEYLIGDRALSQASIAKRMSWASRRKTTRTEDLAYCLLGIFDVSMPLLYGEGQKAFLRLQEEIMKNSDDQTLFAWGYWDDNQSGSKNNQETFQGPFATKPAAFQDCGKLIPDELHESTAAYAITNKGLQINLPIARLSRFSDPLAVLACRPEGQFLQLVAIPVYFHNQDTFSRIGFGKRYIIRRDEISYTSSRPLRFSTSMVNRVTFSRKSELSITYIIQKLPKYDSGLCIWDVQPRSVWDPMQRTIRLGPDERHIVIRLWRKEGEGYAIVLSPKHGCELGFSPGIHLETCRQPLSYDSLHIEPIDSFRSTNFASSHGGNFASRYGLEVTIGDHDIQMPSDPYDHFRTVDITYRTNGGDVMED